MNPIGGMYGLASLLVTHIDHILYTRGSGKLEWCTMQQVISLYVRK